MTGIVILNYLNWRDTVECVESIFKQKYSSYQIIIVDNCSTNNSSKKLHELYDNSSRIDVIDAPKNLGFAKGNNLGIYHLRTNYKVKRILLLNSDTTMSDVNYLKILSELEIDSNCGAIGTCIIGSDGSNQNPEYFPLTRDFSITVINELNNQKNGIKFFVKSLLKKIPGFKKLVVSIKYILKEKEKETYTALHGSAIMLTENYFKTFNGLYPNTFLYFEENILGIIFNKFGLVFLYYPEIEIYHKEDQSSKLAWENSNSVKEKYLLDSVRESMKVFDYTNIELQEIINSDMEIE